MLVRYATLEKDITPEMIAAGVGLVADEVTTDCDGDDDDEPSERVADDDGDEPDLDDNHDSSDDSDDDDDSSNSGDEDGTPLSEDPKLLESMASLRALREAREKQLRI